MNHQGRGRVYQKPQAALNRMDLKNKWITMAKQLAVYQVMVLSLVIVQINHSEISAQAINDQANEQQSTTHAIDEPEKVSILKSESILNPNMELSVPKATIKYDPQLDTNSLSTGPLDLDTQSDQKLTTTGLGEPLKRAYGSSLAQRLSRPLPANELPQDNLYSDSFQSKLASHDAKNRRQMDNLRGDWWTKVAFKPTSIGPSVKQDIDELIEPATTRKPTKHIPWSGPNAKDDRRASKMPATTKRPVYKEQPKNQNPIVTMRYQLSVIRNQHKTLIVKSMRQLQQLDQRLIESYKLCFKRNLPLYGGMLYRSRDFVTRMARDVKLERAKLEGMTRKIQADLKLKLANRTIVREYNKLRANLREPPIEWNSATIPIDEPKEQPREQNSDSETQNETIGDHEQKTRNVKFNRPKVNKYVVSMSEVNLRKELTKVQGLIDRINASTHDMNTVIDDINYLFKLTTSDRDKHHSPKGKYLGKYHKGSFNKSINSPVGALLERYGKLTSGPLANLSQNNDSMREMTEPQALKPLIEPASLVYTDPIDPDLGFDKPVGEGR